MSVTSGFFDYKLVDGVPDRSYNSEELSRLFEGIVTPGVFMHVGNKLEVVVNTGMTIKVRSGRCWFDNKWINNDADLPLEISGTTAAGRWDTVVVELNLNADTADGRWATIKVVRGNENTITPPVQTGTLKQYILAVIKVPPNTTQSLTQAMIVSNVGTATSVTSYPVNWIGTPLTGFSAGYYYQHWQKEFDDWFGNAPLNNGVKQAWSTWFNNTKSAWTTYLVQKESEWKSYIADKTETFTTWFNAVRGQVTGDLGAKLTLAVLGGVDYTLDSDSWVGVGTGGVIDYYKYTIHINALTTDARVDVSLNLSKNDYGYAQDAIKNYSYIYSGEFNSTRTELYLYARSLPIVDLKIQIGGVILNE